VEARGTGRVLDVGVGGVRSAEGDVGADRVIEEVDVLEDDGDMAQDLAR
jgi:hypothetical protein